MILRAITVAVVVAGLVLPTRAGITAFWLPIASGDGSVGTMYPAAAIADDPQLTGMQTWDLMVTTSGDWASAGVLGIIDPNHIAWYHHPLAGNTRPHPALVATHPATAYDTYVTAPSDDGVTGAPYVLGGYYASPTPTWGNTGGLFSVSWGNGTIVVDPPGTYQIARWTFPQAVLPMIYGGDTAQVDPYLLAIIPQIPEPYLMGMWVALALFARLTMPRAAGKSGASIALLVPAQVPATAPPAG